MFVGGHESTSPTTTGRKNAAENREERLPGTHITFDTSTVLYMYFDQQVSHLPRIDAQPGAFVQPSLMATSLVPSTYSAHNGCAD